jgi:hypothetical protein
VIHWIEAITTVRTTGINWGAVSALSTPTIFVVTLVGRVITSKLNRIGDHLSRQDRRSRRTDARLSRVEDKLGLEPLPVDPDWD